MPPAPQIVVDVNKSTIVHPLKLLDYLATLVYAKPAASEASSPSARISISDELEGKEVEPSIPDEGGDVKVTPLEELLGDIEHLLEEIAQKPPTASGFTVMEMVDDLTAFVEESAKACWTAKRYTPWTSFTNCALSLLRDIKNPNFVPVDDLDDNSLIMHLYDPALPGEGGYTRPVPVLVNFSTAKAQYKKSELTWSDFARNHAKTRRSDRSDPDDWDWSTTKLVCELELSVGGLEEDRKACERLRTAINTRSSLGFNLKGFASQKLRDPVLPFVLYCTYTPPKPREDKPPQGSVKENTYARHPREFVPPRKDVIMLESERRSPGEGDAAGDSNETTRKEVQNKNNLKSWPRMEEDPCDNTFVKAGKHLISMLCSSPLMTRSHALVLQGRILYIMIADRSGVIITQGFNVVENVQLYLALLFIFQRLTDRQWGVYVPLDGDTMNINGNAFIPTSLVLRRPWDITGHGSTVRVYQYEPEEDTPKFVAIKLSWPLANRKGEDTYLNAAHEKFSQNDNPNHSVCGHIPLVLDYLKCNDTSTQYIREALGCDLGIPRHLSVLVMQRYAGTIRGLTGRRFVRVLIDCIQAHYLLWKADIRHVNINDNSLVWRPLNPDEKEAYIAQSIEPGCPLDTVIEDADEYVIGILCNFDLAIDDSNTSTAVDGHIETIPFMASRLLDPYQRDDLNVPLPHHYLDDIESFMWVAVIDTATIPSRDFERSRHPLTQEYLSWFDMPTTPRICAILKLAWLRNGGWKIHYPTKTHAAAGTWGKVRWLVDVVVDFRDRELRAQQTSRSLEWFEPDVVYEALVTRFGQK